MSSIGFELASDQRSTWPAPGALATPAAPKVQTPPVKKRAAKTFSRRISSFVVTKVVALRSGASTVSEFARTTSATSLWKPTTGQ